MCSPQTTHVTRTQTTSHASEGAASSPSLELDCRRPWREGGGKRAAQEVADSWSEARGGGGLGEGRGREEHHCW